MPVDPSARIASTARVASGAAIGPDAAVGHFAVIEDDVAIGARSKIEPHVVIKRWTTLGTDNKISTGTVLGSDPLDKTFGDARSYLKIGNGNTIREHYTISRGTAPESVTEIGNDNYIMTSGHIAHNAKIGNGAVIASTALIAGYVEIEDRAFVSGGVVVHQYSRIGELAMIGGMTRVNQDATPYLLHVGPTMEVCGLNLVGLRRAGLNKEEIGRIRQAYKILFRSKLPLREALDRAAVEVAGTHVRHMIEFIGASKRGVCRRGRKREDTDV